MIRLAHDQKVHWLAILAELASFGWGDQRVADRIGTSRQRIGHWRVTRCQPLHDSGTRLLVLWCEVTGKDIVSAPVISMAEDWEE